MNFEIELAFAVVEQAVHETGGEPIKAANYIEDSYRDMADAIDRLAQMGGCPHPHVHTVDCLSEVIARLMDPLPGPSSPSARAVAHSATEAATTAQCRLAAETRAFEDLIASQGEDFGDYGLRHMHGRPLLREMMRKPPANANANEMRTCSMCLPGLPCASCRRAA